MPDKDRIRLAEAMGWKQHPDGWWSTPRKNGVQTHGLDDSPDPFTDANDTETLIRWLNERGYQLLVNHHWSGRNGASLYNTSNGGNFCEHWRGDDWKQGVCELALKVIDDA